MDNEKLKKSIKTRLKRIEGQIKGIEKMVESDCCCTEIMVQIAAVRAAINKVGGLMLENYTKKCIHNEDGCLREENIELLINTITKFLK